MCDENNTVAIQPSASTSYSSSRSSTSSRNTEPFAYGAQRVRKLPMVEDLYIAPHKDSEHRSLASKIWYKIHLETSFMLLDPWERIVMYIVSIAVFCYSISLSVGAFNWLNEMIRAELAS